jgi:hypothetical protein
MIVAVADDERIDEIGHSNEESIAVGVLMNKQQKRANFENYFGIEKRKIEAYNAKIDDANRYNDGRKSNDVTIDGSNDDDERIERHSMIVSDVSLIRWPSNMLASTLPSSQRKTRKHAAKKSTQNADGTNNQKQTAKK